MKTLLTSLLIISTFSSFAFAGDASTKGKVIYDQSCKTCHQASTAALMKSPEAHDVKAWKERLATAEAAAKKDPKQFKTGMDVLVNTVKTGKGAMVPGGMCQDPSTENKKCTDADYIAAINFMMSAKK